MPVKGNLDEIIAANAMAYAAMRDLRKTNAALFAMMAQVERDRGENWRPDGSQPKNTSSTQTSRNRSGSSSSSSRSGSYGSSSGDRTRRR